MATFLQGTNASLEAQFLSYAGGPATDVTGLTVTITPVGSTTPAVGPTSTGVTHVATGLYSYVWAIPTTQAIGDYSVVWNASGGVQASEVITLLPASSGTWASVADVVAITGKTVTQTQLAMANSVIEIFARRTYGFAMADPQNPHVGTRDLEWMKRAVAHQAAWMLSQPDFFSRLDVTTITEGRKAIGLKEQTLLLAPMARMALSRVSWQRTRSIHVRSPFMDGLSPISADPDSAGNDFYDSWTYTPGGG